jgi:hypothetical protein
VKSLRLGAPLLVALVLAACGDGGETREITGPVLEVDARSITEIVSFTVKSGDDRIEVFIDPEAEYAFPPPHLQEHVLSGQPVRVEVVEQDGRLVAVSMEDA